MIRKIPSVFENDPFNKNENLLSGSKRASFEKAGIYLLDSLCCPNKMSINASFFQEKILLLFTNKESNAKVAWGEWPSGPARSISFTEVKHDCVRSEGGWATFRMNDQSSSLYRPSKGTLN